MVQSRILSSQARLEAVSILAHIVQVPCETRFLAGVISLEKIRGTCRNAAQVVTE
jgi:hypothetical protein